MNAASKADETALHAAVFSTESEDHSAKVALVEFLIRSGADLNQRDRWGRTPVYGAVTQRHYDLQTLLLEAGADPDITDNEKRAPIFTAVLNEDLQATRQLIAAGATPTSTTGTAGPPCTCSPSIPITGTSLGIWP